MFDHTDPPVILVTGGAGYIGSHMLLALSDAGFQVVSLDNLSRGFRDAVLTGDFVQCDLGSSSQLDRVFTTYKIAAVMHFAAFAYVGESVSHPEMYYQNNVANTLNLLVAMQRYEVRTLIFSSTCSTFGEPKYVPIDEVHPQNPINAYGRSKWMVEQILADFDRAHGLRAICLRYFNASGADPQGRVGIRSVPQTRLIPLVIQAASGRRPDISVFGRDYPTLDGTCIRDYIHVSDLCQAHLLALKQLLGGGPSQAYNLGNGHGFSVQQVIETAQDVTGKSIRVIDGPRRPGDPAILIGDSRKARTELGWNPQFPDLRTIIEHEWAWEQKLAKSAVGNASQQ
ncbi:MAG: UDP-glucose 4-epimerase [Planctomycetaceae bacterium]|nr:UDP-glucose 4-epimerase [Planctomycetaceae bacterium]